MARDALPDSRMSGEYTRKALLLGSGLFGAQLMWMIYNTYMPIYLQAGNPAFAAKAGIAGFGLSATLAGLIMTLDNVAAFLIQPLMGPVSDRTRTRWGRRMPYILVFGPLAALAFALIPIGPRLIPEALSGDFARLRGPFALMMGAAVAMLLCMALWRTPLFALLPDLFPSPLRSQANALVNIMSGLGGILFFVIGGFLFKLYPPLVFWFGSLATLAAILVLFLAIREPRGPGEAAEAEEGFKVLARLRTLPEANRKSLLLLVLTVFFYQVGYNAVETFFSSYAVAVLGLTASSAAFVLSASFLSFLAFALPSGILARRFGRKRLIEAGLALFALALLAIRLFPSLPAVVAMLALGGCGWALVNINCFPMILDSSTDPGLAGTYSGLYFVASTLAGVLGPVINGRFIDLSGRDYSVIFLVCPAFFVLSLLCVRGVSRGEARAEGAAP